jgi:N-acetyl-anhydromuramyl-L-alanine amidase AmpD
VRVPGIPYIQGRNSYSDADGTKYGIAIHNTANDATAEGEASYAQRRSDGISSHFYVDDNSVIQSLDTNARAGHAGSSNGNQHAIAVEITGTNSKTRAWWLANVAWDELGQVLAACCKKYGIAVRRASVSEMDRNPKVKAFYSHNDMRLAWGGTTHTDPGPNFPWDRLFQAVNAALNPQEDDVIEDSKHGQAVMYRLAGLVSGADSVEGGPTVGEPIWINRALKAVATAVGGVDEAVGAKLKTELDQLDAAVAAARSEIADVDEQVLTQLGAVDSPQEQADLLRAVLGDNAREVGQLLAQS